MPTEEPPPFTVEPNLPCPESGFSQRHPCSSRTGNNELVCTRWSPGPVGH